MFGTEGAERSGRQNRVVAGVLAFIAGFVNTSGFVLIGSFTSHVTGNVGRLASDVTSGDLTAAGFALTLVTAFLAGAFVASMIVESDFLRRTEHAYGLALLGEGLLLVAFTVLSTLVPATGARLRDEEAAILCVAMGMQNSLVTRLSGAVVRTTHLTGVITDLGIEAARWFRWWRASVARHAHIRLSFGHLPRERPSLGKIALLGTIAGSFTCGSIAGALSVARVGRAALLAPSTAVFACAAYAFLTARGTGRPPVDEDTNG